LVTVTGTVPLACAGVSAVIVVALTTVTVDAGAPPMVTTAPVAKFVPVIVTAVPPRVAPEPGVTRVTVGAVGATAFAPLNVAVCMTQSPPAVV